MGTPSTGNNAALNTPLAAIHPAAGAKMGVWFGCALPDDFGDAAAEYRHARETVALIDKNYRAYLSFTGPDRVRYLNAILTSTSQSLRSFPPTMPLLVRFSAPRLRAAALPADWSSAPRAESLERSSSPKPAICRNFGKFFPMRRESTPAGQWDTQR